MRYILILTMAFILAACGAATVSDEGVPTVTPPAVQPTADLVVGEEVEGAELENTDEDDTRAEGEDNDEDVDMDDEDMDSDSSVSLGEIEGPGGVMLTLGEVVTRNSDMTLIFTFDDPEENAATVAELETSDFVLIDAEGNETQPTEVGGALSAQDGLPAEDADQFSLTFDLPTDGEGLRLQVGEFGEIEFDVE